MTIYQAAKGYRRRLNHFFGESVDREYWPAPADERGPPARIRNGAFWRRARDLADRAGVRLIDVLVSSVALVLAAPLFVVIAILIRLDSPGPIIFRHKRVGINRRRGVAGGGSAKERRSVNGFGQPFELYKFRTMYADARARFPQLYAYKYTDEELVTLPIKVLVGSNRDPGSSECAVESLDDRWADPRVTKFGRWLRRTSLDELPNFWNVLKGNMHLIGPRPDIEENVRYYRDDHLRKLDVKPGTTGLAQVNGRGTLTFHEINELDVEYVENRTLMTDLRILVRTGSIVLKGTGAA